jgi:CHAT domain-containing protein
MWLLLLAAGAALVPALGLVREFAAGHFFELGLEAKREWRLKEAVQAFDRALFLKSGLIEARLEKAICHQLRGEFIAAQREFDLLTAERIEAPALRVRLLNSLGANHFNSSEPDEALRAHEESLWLAKQLGDRRGEARALIDLSRVLYHLKGLPDEALERLEQAFQIGREIGDELIEADALRNIGAVRLWFKGELDRAFSECFDPALEIYRRHNDLRGAAITLSNISLFHFEKGDFFWFLKYQDESLEIKHRIDDHAGLSDSYCWLGVIYSHSGLQNYRKALDYFSKSLEICRRTGYRLTQNDVETQMASVYMNLGELDKAIELLEELVDRDRDNPSLINYRLDRLADCYLLKGEPEMALRHIEQSLGSGASDRRQAISALNSLGKIYTGMGEWQKASENLTRAEKLLAEKEKWWAGEIENKLARAELAEKQHRRANAINYLLEAAEIESRILGSTEARFLQGEDRRIYERLFSLLLEQPPEGEAQKGERKEPRPEEETAFRVLEQLRYRSLKNMIVGLGGKSFDAHAGRPEEREAIRRIEQASAALKDQRSARAWKRLGRAYSEYEEIALKSELARAEYRIVRQARPAELEAVQKSLDPETALVEYVLAEDKVFALILTRATLRSVALPATRQSLAAKVKLFRSMVFSGAGPESPDSQWQPVACDLRRLCVEPLEQTGALASIRRVGFVPYGFLHNLPFAALARVEGERARFLVEDYSIFLTPSATYFASRQSRPAATARAARPGLRMLSFGRNRSDEADLGSLISAVDEARAAVSAFGGEVRVDSDASETALKQLARDFNMIHFATHAVSEPQMPLLSRLKLQRTGEDDGNLTVREILDLDLRAELVTLGACRTGQSYSSSGAELGELDRIGLIEAFLRAGSESVLASLLPISDHPTTEFMKLFYKNLRTRGKADALAEAQRAMLAGEIACVENGQHHEFSHPRHWAPFILVGDYR